MGARTATVRHPQGLRKVLRSHDRLTDGVGHHRAADEYRKRRREVEDSDGRYAETFKTHPEQNSRIALEEFQQAMAK
jgi:hypothetical protein